MKKALRIAGKMISLLIVLVAVAVMLFTVISVTTLDRSDRQLFGYKAFIVLSDSMKATDFAAGDVVVVKSVDPDTLQPGNIIAYTSQNEESFGETVTHKIRAKTRDANGEAGFITYGTSTDTDDATVVTYPYILGQYQFRLAGVGSFFRFLKTVPGYIICILIPFLLLIGMQAWNTVKLFRKYRLEQLQQLEAERQQLEAERAQSAQMMEELRALKEQLSKVQASGAGKE